MAAGDPLICNATVQVFRNNAPIGPASIVAHIGPSKNIVFQAEGGLQRRVVLMNLSTDIQPTDDLLILTVNGNPPRKPGPFEVEDAVEDGGSLGLQLLEVYLIGF